MALPSKKRPKSEKRKRAISYQLRKFNLISCPKCKKPVLPHHLCSFCGTYANKQILEIKIEKPKERK